MDLATSTLWWILAGVLVAVELLTGSFYLLMLAIGAASGAIAAHAGVALPAQTVIAALVGGVATAAWHLKRARNPRSAPAESNRDVNLDIGQSVQVTGWLPDGTARVHYRGAMWTAQHVGPGPARTGAHVIASVSGNQLGLVPADVATQA